MKKLLCILLSILMLTPILTYSISAADENIAISAPESTDEADNENAPEDWALAEIEIAMQKGLLTDSVCEDFKADITREQFCEIIINAYEKLNKEPINIENISFNDTDNVSILKAYAVGVVNGYGDGIFGPDDKITREQIATMVVRMIDKANIGVDINAHNDFEFIDVSDISDWSLPALKFVHGSALLVDMVVPNRADAKEFVTCEEAILLAHRAYDRFAFYGKETMAQILAKDFEEYATDEASALSVAEDIVKNDAIPFAPVATEAQEGYLMGFGESEIKGFKEAAVFAPVVGTIPFIGYIFTLYDGADTVEFKKMLDSESKLNWNICTSADEKLILSKGNKIFFIMSPYGIEE